MATTDSMNASSKVVADFADKAKGVLVETHRLNAGGWNVEAAHAHQEDLSDLADYAGNLGLERIHAAALDLYAYVSVFTEGTMRPNPAQRAELDRLIQDAQSAVLELAPSVAKLTGAIVYLLAPGLEEPNGLAPSLRQESLQLAVFQDGDAFADAIRAHLPQAILAEGAFVGSVSELLDDLAPTVPEATRLPLIGIGGGDASARLQALVGGADLFIARLDDPTLAAQVRELLSNQSIEPFRVLVVDDDRQMGTYCDAILSRAGMIVESTTEADTVIERVRRFRPDLVLMDLYLPGIDGMTLTAQLRQLADAVVLPIVFLSGEQSEEARFQAIQVGGDDFLTKPVRPRHLVAAVRSRIKRVRTLSKQLIRRPGDAQGHMRRGAFLDHLREVKGRTPGPATALMVIAVDQAHDLSDRLALSVGHELEQAVALRLAKGFSREDRYCLIQEFGFGLSLERDRRDEILETAETLRALVADQPFKIDGTDTKLTASVGMALMPNLERSLDDWINAAFAAVRTAGRLGGNRVEGILSDNGSGLSPERQMRIRELLRDATSPHGLVFDFQPLIPLRATETGHYAMLMHLRDPKEPLGGVTRADFMPVARDLRVQAAIDRLAITRALEALDDQRSRNRVNNLVVPIDALSIDREQLTWLQSEFSRRKNIEQTLTLEFDANALTEIGAERMLERLEAVGVRFAAVDRSGRLGHIKGLEALPLNTLRLPAAALQAMEASLVTPVLEAWYRSERDIIIDEIRDLTLIGKFWNMGISYLQGDVLATAGPRLDFDFSEISLG